MPQLSSVILLISGIVLLLSGCMGSGTAEETAAAENASLGTSVAQVRSTATAEADRYQATMETLRTATTSAWNRRQRLAGTLEAMGYAPEQINAVTPILPTATPDLDTLSSSSVTGNRPGAVGGVTLIPSTPDFRTAAPTATPLFIPTIDTSGPYFDNIVTSTGYGSDDCAEGITSTFAPSTQEIYVIMNAYNIQPGTVLVSRWYKDSAEQVMHEFVPNFAINGPCIWFYTDQTEMDFTPGSSYSVTLEINGVPFGQPVNFSIAGADAPDAAGDSGENSD
jgi:hypothetical protein